MKQILHKFFSKKSRNSYEQFDLVESLRITGMLVVIIGCGEKSSLCFLLDTGANCNHIDYASFNGKYNLLEEIPEVTNIKGVDGINHSAKRYNLRFGTNMDLKLPVTALPENNGVAQLKNEFGFPVNGILGLDFMQRTKCVIDLAKKTVLVDFTALQAA